MPKSCSIVKNINACWYREQSAGPPAKQERRIALILFPLRCHDLRWRLVCPRPLGCRKMIDAQKEACKPQMPG